LKWQGSATVAGSITHIVFKSGDRTMKVICAAILAELPDDRGSSALPADDRSLLPARWPFSLKHAIQKSRKQDMASVFHQSAIISNCI
jgi:hypothetical protein